MSSHTGASVPTLDTAEMEQTLACPPRKPLSSNRPAMPAPAPRLPAKWAVAMQRASSTLNGSTEGSSTPTVAAGSGPEFDRRLDGFLTSFQQEISAARALKEQLDRAEGEPIRQEEKKAQLRERMRKIRNLFANEGEEFVRTLEARNPALAQAKYGANTLEIARGIDKLEQAMNLEQQRRNNHNNNDESQHAVPTNLRALNIIPGGDFTLNEINHSEETLCLMQSDIQALKLDLMRLQRSKAASNSRTIPPDHRKTTDPAMTSSAVLQKTPSTGDTNVLSFMSSAGLEETPNTARTMTTTTTTTTTSTTAMISAMASGKSTASKSAASKTQPPGYVHHLEQMKSRLEALQKKKPVVRPRRKSPSGKKLVRSATYSSVRIEGSIFDENHKPAQVVPQTLPALNPDFEVHARVLGENAMNIAANTPFDYSNKISGPSPKRPGTPTPVCNSALKVTESLPASPGSPTSSEGFSPVNNRTRIIRGSRSHALSIDAPEELLSRPQSRAAAVDMQRYSLKVAKRFISNDNIDGKGKSKLRGRSISELSPSNLAKVNQTRTPQAMVEPRNQAKNSQHSEMDAPGDSEGCGKRANTNIDDYTASENDQLGSRRDMGSVVVEERESDLWMRRGLIWRRWRRRFASIVSHQFFGRVLCLFSYSSSGAVISTRSQIIVLREAVVSPMRDVIEHSSGSRYGFVLRTASKEYYLAAQDQVARSAWLKDLRKAAGTPNLSFVRPSQSLHERLSKIRDRDRPAASRLISSSSRRLLARLK